MRFIAYAAAATLLAGCPKGSLPIDLNQFKPTVRYERLSVDRIDFTGADTQFVFSLRNPNPVAVRVSSFRYDLDLAGSGFVDGQSDTGLELAAGGETQFTLPVSVVFAELAQIAQGLDDADEIPFAVSGDFGFDTPVGEVKVPYQEQGAFPIVRAPRFRVAGARVATFRPLENRATLEIDMGITHRGGASLTFDGFEVDLSLAGQSVASGMAAELPEVAAGDEQIVTLPISVNLLELGTTVVGAITRKERIDIGLGAQMTVGTPYGALPLTVDETGDVQLQ